MIAVTHHGRRDVRVDNVPDPAIQEPTDAIVRVTISGICDPRWRRISRAAGPPPAAQAVAVRTATNTR